MKFFLLAGGYGKRADPLSREKPKPAFPFNGVPLIRIMVDQLKRRGCFPGFINTHHLPEAISAIVRQETGIAIFFEESLSGSRVLQRSLQNEYDRLLVLNGDVFMEIPIRGMIDLLEKRGSDGVLLVRPLAPGYSGLEIRDGSFSRVFPSSERVDRPAFMYAGAALFTRNVVEKIDDTSFFRSLERENLNISCLDYRDIWLDIGTPRSYFNAVWDYLHHIGNTDQNSLSAAVSISPQALLRQSIVWENTTISGNSDIIGCIVTSGLRLTDCRASRSLITSQGIFPF